jgi:hypothetical protein
LGITRPASRANAVHQRTFFRARAQVDGAAAWSARRSRCPARLEASGPVEGISERSLGSCAQRPASPGYGAVRAGAPRLYDLLAPVYGWFIEGFNTADLKDASALLDELA